MRRDRWADRLRLMRDMGLRATSIYVPWNWHHTDPDAPPDLDGRTHPQRDLRGVLDEIAAAGLDCIFRPGPFITAEWRNGGLPDWLWERDPTVLALDHTGGVSGPDHPYAALTHAHPGYREAEVAWLRAACSVAVDHLATRGGTVIDVQLDDEPSYFQRLTANPLAADYNPLLIGDPGGDEPSRFGGWVLERHGSLDAVNAAYGTRWVRPGDVVPPRTPMATQADLAAHGDWFDFKVNEINLDMEHQFRTVAGVGIDVPISMLFPYLLTLGAVRFTDFIEARDLPIHLTNEVYLSLFGTSSSDERKLGDIVASHETYTGVWLRGHGPAISMELQGSNSTNITPGAMELLYAITVARGIKGINIYMMVGGENPAGFEAVTGRGYDICAPIALDGTERPHGGVLRKLAQVLEAGGGALLHGQPLRDTWIGCIPRYERAAVVGSDGPMADVAELLTTTFSGGEMGMSNASSLPSLMVGSSVSFGAVNLEAADADVLAAKPQIWVPGVGFMDGAVQAKLLAYIRGGGHAIILPEVPRRGEDGEPCDVLWDAAMHGVGVMAPDPRSSPEAMHMLSTPEGESIVAPGRRWSFDLPDDAQALAHDTKDGRAVGFSRQIGAGIVTVLGFNLQYVPNEQEDQKDLLERLVTGAGVRPLATQASNRRIAAMQLSAPSGVFVCLVNPVELPAATRVRCTAPDGTAYAFPQDLDAISFHGAGARLLPVGLHLDSGITLEHSTWELLAIDDTPGLRLLTFATPGAAPGEIRISGAPVARVDRADVQASTPGAASDTVLVLLPRAETCTIEVAVTAATDTRAGGGDR